MVLNTEAFQLMDMPNVKQIILAFNFVFKLDSFHKTNFRRLICLDIFGDPMISSKVGRIKFKKQERPVFNL